MKNFYYTVKAVVLVAFAFIGWFLLKSWSGGKKPEVKIRDIKASWEKSKEGNNEKTIITDNDIDTELDKLRKS